MACESAANGSPNDHFIFVTDQLLGSASAPAPWAKSGTTAAATSKPFIGAEGANDYVSWFNAPVGAAVTKSLSGSGVVEGIIDFEETFGTAHPVVYLAAAAYETPDGGDLIAIAPTGGGPDLNPGEFLPLPLIAFEDHNGDGLFDRLDPAIGFRIESANVEDGGLRFSFASVPGRTYRVLHRSALTQSWSELSGSTQTASGLQTSISVTHQPGTPAHFYRIELLP